MEHISISSPRRKLSSSQPNPIEPLNRPTELDIGAEEKAHVEEDSAWRPNWLRPFVLVTFARLFLCATVALLNMLCYSYKNDGLFRTDSNHTFVWRFGPAARSGESAPSTQGLNGSSAYYVGRAISDFNLSYTFGVTKDAAFQLFEPRGSTDALITVPVDGFFTDMHCLKLESFEVLRTNGSRLFELSVNFEGCHNLRYRILKRNDTIWNLGPPLYHYRPCPNIPRQNPHRGVVDNGISSKLRIPEGQSQIPHSVNVWAMIERSLPIKFRSVWGPRSMGATWGKAPNGPKALLNTTEALYDCMVNMVRKLGPLAGHYNLRQEESTETMGNERRQVAKLKIKYQTGAPIVAVFALVTAINIFIFIRYREETMIWNRDLATVLGYMLFFHAHQRFIDQKSCFEQSHTEAWQGPSRFAPAILRKWVQTAFTVVILAIITVLLYTLKTSNANNGLTSTKRDNHMFWASLPTLTMLGVALYTESFNSSLRGFFTLDILSKGPCRSQQFDITLLDLLGLRALYTAVRLKAWPVSLSQSLASLCALLTTIASTLLTVKFVPEHDKFELRQESSFGKRPLEPDERHYCNNREFVGSLVLEKGENLTYPQNTFRDLAFPGTGRLPPTLVARCESQALSVSKTKDDNEPLFFLRIPVTCSDGTSDTLNITISDSSMLSKDPRKSSFVYAEILGFEASERDSQGHNAVCDMDMDTFHNRSVLDSAPSISKVYLWGVFDFQKHHFNSLQAWRCRYSWAMIMVSVDLFIANGTLVINHNKPPRPDRPTLIPWEPPLSVPFLDPQTERIGRKEYHGNAFPEVTQSHGLETWFNAFNILVPPHGRVPLEAFGDPGQSWRILEALNFDRALLSAQILNIENRINIEDMQSEGLEPLNAVLINNNNAKRLFQNPTSTYLLVGILSIVGIVHIFILIPSVLQRFTNWRRGLLDIDVKGLAPDGLSSIAMMAALLDTSNFAKHMPDDSHKLSKEDIYDRLSSMRFRMSWFRRESDRTMHFTVGVMDDDDFKFVGSRRTVVMKNWVTKTLTGKT
ncbi:hypothetical protein Landi51_07764 [Colletotrichum acutatum]